MRYGWRARQRLPRRMRRRTLRRARLGYGQLVLALVVVLSALALRAGATHAQGPEHEHADHTAWAQGGEGWPFHGDQVLRPGLTVATAEATGMRPRQVARQLRAGQSLTDIAVGAGVSADEVLAVFDEMVTARLGGKAETGELPASVAEARVRWYMNAARQMMEQPGMEPAYPGLHELHVTIITGAVAAGDLPRATIRAELKTCRTLDDILTEAGSSGEAAVEEALAFVDGRLAELVTSGEVSETQRTAWHDGIQAALTNMVATPGVHVAGTECAAN